MLRGASVPASGPLISVHNSFKVGRFVFSMFDPTSAPRKRKKNGDSGMNVPVLGVFSTKKLPKRKNMKRTALQRFVTNSR